MTAIINVFWVFLKLGCTSFGGPIAHLMYFRKEFVERQQLMQEHEYAQLLSLCQALPGPASSQVGFAIGIRMAGLLGGLAAFIAFTLPSIILLLIFAHYLFWFQTALGLAALKGLTILALVVVLQGLLGMSKQLCASKLTFSIAAMSFVCTVLANSVYMQFGVIFGGLLVAYIFNSNTQGTSEESASLLGVIATQTQRIKRWMSITALSVFVGLFVGLLLLPHLHIESDVLNIANTFYLPGALVFGGGHVVLPLLEQSTVAQGIISEDLFLAGYGATQALPGPMFSFASFLGYVIENNASPYLNAVLATLFVFLPGFLLIIVCLPLWHNVARNALFGRALAGANAAVVGLLAATLYDPIFLHAVDTTIDLAIAAIAFTLLFRWQVPVVGIALLCVATSMGASLL